MPSVTNQNYLFIEEKINSLKETFPILRNKTDDYVFSVLCVKSNFYKNPSFQFGNTEIDCTIVDGVNDGGIDALLNDPNSEESNLVLCQSKHYTHIEFEDVRDAVNKMALFYKDMIRGNYENVNNKVQRQFLTLNAEFGEESKVIFVFYTSAPKSGIRKDRIERALSETLNNCCKFELHLLFDEDIVDEIKESESRRATIESGKISIDEANNCLYYQDDSAGIVNVSAFSIKELYARHNTNLLARNLRYHISGRDIDNAISKTIKEEPRSFWYKNNGITIVCDDFEVDGKEVKLSNFSIVNGGQTTYMIHKSKEINREYDLFLPCKIIKVNGNNEDEKNQFSLEIAKATNSQKAIKAVDLKANAPEQVRFSNSMRQVGIFYQTKRGETIPNDFKIDYKNSDLSEIGKLSLAAIFQLPASSRSKPSTLYNPEYYDLTFSSNQQQIASLMKELLYVDYYFRNSFLKKFDSKYENSPHTDIIPFAHNSRTLCIAFTAFASRYMQQNITTEDLSTIFAHAGKDGAYMSYFYDIFKQIDNVTNLFTRDVFDDKDKLDEILFKLFEAIIIAGRKCYNIEKRNNDSLNETNYLKKDSNYYLILSDEWDVLMTKIEECFN